MITERFLELQKFKLNEIFELFNFLLIGSEKNGIIPCLPFNKDISEIQYKPFVDYKTDTASDKLPLLSDAYWHTIDDVLTQYVRHSDNKFDYDNEGIAHRKHIIADQIRYISKKSNNLDDNLTDLENHDYLEFSNDHEIFKNNGFTYWILSLKPKDVKDKGISHQALYYQKSLIRNGKSLNFKQKVVKILLQLYKDTILNNEN